MQSDNTMRPIGLGVFAEYINVSGSQRMRTIADQYSRYTDPEHRAVIPYRAASAGIKRAVKDKDPRVLDDMIGRASEKMRSHYEDLARGMRAFMARHNPAYIETPAATWAYGDLTLRVHEHIGMLLGKRPHLVFPYLKQPQLTTDGAKAIWRTLELAQDRILPSSEILVLDVRRNQTFRPTRVDRQRLDCWIESEALGYVDHWRRIASGGEAAG